MLVYHLVGEQPAPACLTAIQFPADAEHFFITTERFAAAAENVVAVLRTKGIRSQIYSFGNAAVASDFNALREKFDTMLGRTNPARENIVFDVTGGTKPMAIFALLLQRQLPYKARYVYLDFNKKELFHFGETNHSEPLTETLSIEDFIGLAGKKMRAHAREIPDAMRQLAYRHRYAVVRVQGKFAAAVSKGNNDSLFTAAYDEFLAILDKVGARAEWERVFDETFAEERTSVKAGYLAGGWFEDYVCQLVKTNFPELEVVSNAAIFWRDDPMEAQEFDVVYSDGFSFTILECKAGNLKQEHFQKLENLRNTFSGALGKSALVTLKPSMQSRNVRINARIKDSSGIAAFCGESGLGKLSRHALDFLPGHIYE